MKIWYNIRTFCHSICHSIKGYTKNLLCLFVLKI
nr:MAG TPA: hypothetical protein [Caudoviricetes sp.]